ncbi:Hypothetical protein BN69_1105 [Methylocystis sp. SC2]|nr:Hypothetical protein BN69_1105 [Methylocystis sp. SC2]
MKRGRDFGGTAPRRQCATLARSARRNFYGPVASAPRLSACDEAIRCSEDRHMPAQIGQGGA